MKKPKKDEFVLKKFKMLKDGGAYVEWSTKYAANNAAHSDEFKVSRTLNIHEDLRLMLHDQKPNILKFEEINYRLVTTTAEQRQVEGIEDISVITEELQTEALTKIQVTGFTISGKENKRQVILTYDKRTGNKKIIGRCTTNILLSADVFGFEEDLEAQVEEFTDEIYKYLYTNKHSDSDQMELDFYAIEEKKVEDAEKIKEEIENED